MAVSVIQEFPATAEQYDQVNEKLGVDSDPPAGLIVHTAAVIEGGIRVIDVWESAEAFGAFAEQRIGPAVVEVMGDAAGPPPSVEIAELHHVVTP